MMRIPWSKIERASVLAVDTECSGLFPDDGDRLACLAVAWKEKSMIKSFGFPFDQGVLDKGERQQDVLFEFIEEDDNMSEAVWTRLLSILATKKLVFHNGGFDLQMLLAGTRHWSGVDLSDRWSWDTMIAHQVIRPLSSAGLDNAVSELCGGGKSDTTEMTEWLKKNKQGKYRYDLLPWSMVQEYVENDTRSTLDLYEAQQHLAQEEDISAAHLQREFNLARVLFLMEKRGISYDANKSLAAAEILNTRADEIAATMPFAVTPPAAKAYWTAAGMEFPNYTEKGAPSLDDETVRKWSAEGVPWAKEYREVTRARKAVKMWYLGYTEKLGEDGRLRCRFRQTLKFNDKGTAEGARSGRLSVERVNLQAMPKADKIEHGVPGVRTLLRAREGCQLWSLDMQQAELRVAAIYARCQPMIDALLTGADFHGQTTERVLGVKKSAPDWKLKRDIGKKLTFGSLFHIGGEGFQRLLAREADIHWPLKDCEDAVWGWRRAYPEFDVAYRKAEKAFTDRGYMRILPGTEYETRSYLRDRDWARTGWNRMVQGSLAAWLRLWLVMVEENWPDVLNLTVHDSLMLELPIVSAEATAKEIAAVSSARASELFKFEMPVEIECYQR